MKNKFNNCPYCNSLLKQEEDFSICIKDNLKVTYDKFGFVVYFASKSWVCHFIGLDKVYIVFNGNSFGFSSHNIDECIDYVSRSIKNIDLE